MARSLFAPLPRRLLAWRSLPSWSIPRRHPAGESLARRSLLRRPLAVAAAAAAGATLVPGALAAPGGSCTAPGQQGRAAAAVRFAAARYRLEADGAAVHVAVGRVAADRVLTGALRAGNLGAAAAEAMRVVQSHQHVTAIRVVRGTRVLVQTTLYPFDVAGAGRTLRDRRGAYLGTLEVTIQDVIGFIRLVHKFTGSEVVVRGAGGTAKSSLGAALGVRLPTEGCVRVAGRGYAVRSFTETSFTGEALRVSILRAG